MPGQHADCGETRRYRASIRPHHHHSSSARRLHLRSPDGERRLQCSYQGAHLRRELAESQLDPFGILQSCSGPTSTVIITVTICHFDFQGCDRQVFEILYHVCTRTMLPEGTKTEDLQNIRSRYRARSVEENRRYYSGLGTSPASKCFEYPIVHKGFGEYPLLCR